MQLLALLRNEIWPFGKQAGAGGIIRCCCCFCRPVSSNAQSERRYDQRHRGVFFRQPEQQMDIEPGARYENTTLRWLTLKNTHTWMSIYDYIQPHVPWSALDTSTQQFQFHIWIPYREKAHKHVCVGAQEMLKCSPHIDGAHRCSATQDISCSQ